MKIYLTIALLTLSGLAYAHAHGWMKQNESHGQDAYGNPVVICNWVCRTDYNNVHYAQTQGFGYCPMPY